VEYGAALVAAPAAPVKDPDHPYIQLGDKGTSVEKMQHLLLPVGAHSMGKLSANLQRVDHMAVRPFQW
jgi:hypothetical protein